MKNAEAITEISRLKAEIARLRTVIKRQGKLNAEAFKRMQEAEKCAQDYANELAEVYGSAEE